MQSHVMYAVLLLAGLSACNPFKDSAPPDKPMRMEERREQSRGKLTGDGFDFFGGGKDAAASGGAALGVNSYVWRATLDTLSFMPLASADPFGGTILTDWYEDPKTPGERYKVNALIMDTTLRADAVKVQVFKQRQEAGAWKDIAVSSDLPRKLEDTILTRAREIRINRSDGGS